MAMVDRFVFLDDVQLTRRSWQIRNRVLVGGLAHWISAPTRHQGRDQTIAETAIADDHNWRRKLSALLRQEYGRHPFFSELATLIAHIDKSTASNLADLNISIIAFCAQRFSITTPVSRSGEMSLIANQRTERLIEICKRLGCDIYLSPIGSAEYLAEDGFALLTDLKLEFFEEAPPRYSQHGVDEYISHLSVIDLIANLGWKGSGEYIRTPWSAKESTT